MFLQIAFITLLIRGKRAFFVEKGEKWTLTEVLISWEARVFLEGGIGGKKTEVPLTILVNWEYNGIDQFGQY
ncbi:hypothetical protein AB1K84_04630 [Mesobacillus foraminis]|uniref:hypothetical protein n=1 Tax=Mesobacillus foraminis TaxID=279826 RepID=UPI0039A277EA